MPPSDVQTAQLSHIKTALTSKDPVVVALGLDVSELYAAPCTHPDGSEGWSIPFSYLDVVNAPVLVDATALPRADIARLADDIAAALSAFSALPAVATAAWDQDPDLGGDFVRLTAHVPMDRDTYRASAGAMYEVLARILDKIGRASCRERV